MSNTVGDLKFLLNQFSDGENNTPIEDLFIKKTDVHGIFKKLTTVSSIKVVDLKLPGYCRVAEPHVVDANVKTVLLID